MNFYYIALYESNRKKVMYLGVDMYRLAASVVVYSGPFLLHGILRRL